MFRFLFALLPFLLLQQTPPAGDPPEEKPKVDDKPKVEFTAEQQARVNDIEARIRKDTEERIRAEVKQQADEAKKKTDAAAELKKQQDAGEFDKVKTTLEAERDEAKSTVETITAERDEYRKLVEDDVKTAWKDIPEKVRKTYTGADDDVLAKKRHMVLMAELIEELADKKAKPRGAGFDPPPGGKALDERQEVQRIRSRIAPL